MLVEENTEYKMIYAFNEKASKLKKNVISKWFICEGGGYEVSHKYTKNGSD